jgi:hypothetical protein
VVHYQRQASSFNPSYGGFVLKIGDYVIVIEEDIDTFLLNELVMLVDMDNTPRYPYCVKYANERFWVDKVVKATPLIKALL